MDQVTMCKRPGCVAQVDNGAEYCGVHRAAVGKRCERCRGTGSYFYRGQDLTMACQWCGGTGQLDQKAHAPRRRPGDDPVEQRGLIQLSQDE